MLQTIEKMLIYIYLFNFYRYASNYIFTLCTLSLFAVVLVRPVVCNTYVANCRSLSVVDQVLIIVLMGPVLVNSNVRSRISISLSD